MSHRLGGRRVSDEPNLDDAKVGSKGRGTVKMGSTFGLGNERSGRVKEAEERVRRCRHNREAAERTLVSC